MPQNVTPNSDPLRSFYDRRHPLYAENETHWKFLFDTYRGGREWFSDNLFKYHKEGEDEFTSRKDRAYRFNHTREVVDLVQKYLFKSTITRNHEEAPERVKEFWAVSMRGGNDIDTLMRECAVNASVGGRSAIVVDNNVPDLVNEDGSPRAISISESAGYRCYAYSVPVRDVLDYAWDEEGDGKLLWIKLREWFRDDFDPMHSTGLIEPRVRLWTRDGWSLYKEVETTGDNGKGQKSKSTTQVQTIDSGTHKLGFVPVDLMDHTISSDPYYSPSLIEDIAYLDRAVANYLSNLDAIIQDQTFSQLAMPAQAVQRGDDMYQKLLELGTKRIFIYDGGATGAKPEYLSPDPKQAGVILTVINKIINEIYHTVGLAGERTKEDNAVGIDNSSGVAKAYDFERVNSLLLNKAKACEHAENWIVSTVMAWWGEEYTEKLVTYPTTFDVMRLVDDLVTAEALQKVAAPKEMRRQQMRGMVDRIFPQLKKDLREKIMKDIDTWAEEPVESEAPKLPGGKPVSENKRQGQVTKDTDKKEKAK